MRFETGKDQLLFHAFATHAIAGGVDAKTLSGILGHTDAAFTLNTCTHVTGDIHRRAAEDLQQFYTELKQNGRLLRRDLYGPGVSDRLVEGCHLRIRSALAEAVEERLIPRNPAEDCHLPQSTRREKQVLTREELQRFLTQAQDEGYYELVLLELATGLRRGEILALKWSDLNPKTGELKVERQVYRTGGKLTVAPPKTKTSKRSLLIPKTLLAVLNDLRARAVSSPPRSSPTPLSTRPPCASASRRSWTTPAAASSVSTTCATPSPRCRWRPAWT